MGTIRVTGPFYMVRFAEISQELAAELINGDKDCIDMYWDIQEPEYTETYRSLYGAESLDLTLDDTVISCGEDFVCRSAECDHQEPSESPYLVSDYNFSRTGENKCFFIARELCEGDEERIFDEAFDNNKLDVTKVALNAGEEVIATVYQVNYEGAEIADLTESDYDAFYVFQNGSLIELE